MVKREGHLLIKVEKVQGIMRARQKYGFCKLHLKKVKKKGDKHLKCSSTGKPVKCCNCKHFEPMPNDSREQWRRL